MSSQVASAEVLVKIPKGKPCKQECLKGCDPKLSFGCDCVVGCTDYYLDPLNCYVGITGLLTDHQCIVFDEMWGGCGQCIGCKDDCPSNYCGINGFYGNPGLYGPNPFLAQQPFTANAALAVEGASNQANMMAQQMMQNGNGAMGQQGMMQMMAGARKASARRVALRK